MLDERVRWTAAHCRHYAMCRIDYLGTGLCPAGAARPYVAYFPQGRMDLVDYLARGLVPVTEALVDIAETCDLCGACDLQCHFYTEMRPLPVMEALKQAVAEHLRGGREPVRPQPDAFVEDLRRIVGGPWASNDPAVTATYADDPFPLTGMRVPRAVALPGSAEEVEAVVRLAAGAGIPFAVRGSGASVYGQVYTEGLVLDTARMREMEFDPANWSVTVGPGVTAFDLQREASRRGFRVNVAEPAATVIGNILCTGLFSTWAAGYGMGADHVLDMEFVGRDGTRFRLAGGGSEPLARRDAAGASGATGATAATATEPPPVAARIPDATGPRLLAYRHRAGEVPGVCTRASIRLHPVTGDEEGLLVPFAALEPALGFARDLSIRRLGTSLAVLGPHFLASFLSPSFEVQEALKRALAEDLGMPYAVHVVADRFGCEAVRSLAGSARLPVIDQDLYRTLALGLPRLVEPQTLDRIRSAEGGETPVALLAAPELRPILEAVLDPTPETYASAVDPDLREAYVRLYRRPELTDLVWLAEFRIVSARMARRKHVVVWLLFVPMEPEFVSSLGERLGRVAEENGIEHAYGFVTPLDHGKRAVFEYDYYIDQADSVEKERIGRAMAELVPWLDGLSQGPASNMTWLRTVFTQGCARKEGWFYRDLAGREVA
jgi:FAD/FMN-containing dehydrogenase